MTNSAAKSAEHGATGHEESFGDIVTHHLTELETMSIPWWSHGRFKSLSLESLQFDLFGFDLSITKPVVYLWVASVILILILTLPFRGGKLLRSKFANLIEVYIVFIRDEVIYPNLGEKDGRRMLPFFLTIFFFILTMNMCGLIPWGNSPTGNINVTAGLAIVAFFTIQAQGIMQNGLGGHLKALLPPGLPAFVIPIMIPVEIMGTFAKPFALCIRLFANMVAGHAVIIVLLLLILQGGYFISPMPIFGILFISLLEIFVAHLQAFIFTILSALFVSMAIHPSH